MTYDRAKPAKQGQVRADLRRQRQTCQRAARALAGVENQNDPEPRPAQHASRIGGADVMAAVQADVHAAKEPGQQAERNAPHEVGRNEGGGSPDPAHARALTRKDRAKVVNSAIISYRSMGVIR